MITDILKKRLIEEAVIALKNPYPRNSKNSYAAAVLTDIGNIYSANYYHSDTRSLTVHGEQAVLIHAAAHGEGNIVAIVITSNADLPKGEFTAPCHMCKQILWESRLRSDIPMLIILANRYEETKEVMLDELMPLPWPARKLN